jgi:hypothetical protein
MGVVTTLRACRQGWLRAWGFARPAAAGLLVTTEITLAASNRQADYCSDSSLDSTTPPTRRAAWTALHRASLGADRDRADSAILARHESA